MASAFCEFPDEVLVAAPDDVGLNIAEAESLLADPFDQVGEAVVIDVANTVRCCVEIDAVDDALQKRVLIGDCAKVRRQFLAEVLQIILTGGPRAVFAGSDYRPDRVVWIQRLKGQIKPDERLVVLYQLEGFRPRADFRCDSIQLVLKDVAQAFGEDQREDVVLELRRVLCAANGARCVPDLGFE